VTCVVVREQRLGARRDDHRAGRDACERSDRRRSPAKGRCEREAEERQQRDQEARSRDPAAERHVHPVVARGPRHLHDAERRDECRLGPQPAPPEQEDTSGAGHDDRRQHQQASLAQQQLDRDTQIGEVEGEEAVVARGLLDAACAGIERHAGVGKVEGVPEGPGVEGKQRDEADDPSHSERNQAPYAWRARRRVQAEQRRRHGQRQIGGCRQTSGSSGCGNAPPTCVVPGEQQREGEKRERRRRHMRKQERRERQHERRQAERRQHDCPEPDLPERSQRHTEHRSRVAEAVVAIRGYGADRVQQQIPGGSPEVERRTFRGVEVAVRPDEITGLLRVFVDRRVALRALC
jgi:hypothetical protein